jgi:hypothetical protein
MSVTGELETLATYPNPETRKKIKCLAYRVSQTHGLVPVQVHEMQLDIPPHPELLVVAFVHSN